MIIFERNGETDSTPIIHRALFEIVVSDTVPTNNESECERVFGKVFALLNGQLRERTKSMWRKST